MARRMLNNPASGDGSSVREVFTVSPELTSKIALLEAQLAAERERHLQVVEKEVLRDDPALLEKFNQAMRELGKLKSSISAAPAGAAVQLVEVEKVVEKVVEVPRIVRQLSVVYVISKRKAALVFCLGAAASQLALYVINKL